MPQVFEARAACGFGQGLAQAVKPAPPVNLPGKAPDACKRFNDPLFGNGIPLPGSVEFCKIAVPLKSAFEDIGKSFLEWFKAFSVKDMLTARLKLPLIGSKLFGWLDYLISTWNDLVDQVGDSISSALSVVGGLATELLQVQRCLTNRCSPAASIGVWALKVILDIIEQIDIGIDPGIVAEIHLHIRFPQVKEWLDLIEKYLCPLEVPSAQDATRGWIMGLITKEQRDCIWQLNGLSPDTYETFALLDRERLDWREAIQYLRRSGGNDVDEDIALQSRGFIDVSDRAAAKEMYWELPGIADHLTWLQRNVFDTDYVQHFHLMDGFASDDEISKLPGLNGYTSIARRPGKTFWDAFGQDLTALGMRQQYAAYHYAAHWIMPSPEQLKEFLYRSDEIQAATGQPFTLDDMDRLLTEQDYNVLARKWFTSTAYSVPAISYIKDMYRQGVINKEQLATYHQRLGYAKVDADRFADIDELQRLRQRASQTQGWTTRSATQAWLAGQIDEARHDTVFTDLGYTTYEAGTAREVAQKTYNVSIVRRARSKALQSIATTVTQAIDVGAIRPIDAAYQMVAAGWPRDAAESYTSVQSALSGVKRLKSGIAYLKRMVLDGVVTFPAAQLELQRMGIVPDAIASYLQLWLLQLTPGRKRRSATNIVNDVANGHITTAVGAVMLANLGYNDVDTRLYLADAQSKVTQLKQKQLAASQKKGLARSKAAAALVKAAKKQHADLLKQLTHEMPLATLKKWASLGIIGKDLFMERMGLYGYDFTDAERYYKEACAGKSAACVDTTPVIKDTNGTGGSGGTTSGGSGK